MDRGVRIDRTYQLNFGGNTDFLNMLERERLESKKISKTNAVTSMLDYEMDPDNVHVGPSDYVPWLKDRKWCHIRVEGTTYGDVPLNMELKLEVWDSPNSAGVITDAIRCLKLGLDRGLKGTLVAPSSYFMKSPPIQIADDISRERVEAFIRGEDDETLDGSDANVHAAIRTSRQSAPKAKAPAKAATSKALDARRRRPPAARGPRRRAPRRADAVSREADDRDLATRIREKAVVRAYRASTWALGRAPERVSGEVGGVLAESTYLAWPARRRATRESLARVLGTTPDDPRVDRLGRRTLPELRPLRRGPHAPAEHAAPRARLARGHVRGRRRATELREQGRGVILVGAHVGHNEAGAAAVADRGWKINVVADDTEFRELFELLKEQRGRWGVRLIPWTSLRELYSALKRKRDRGPPRGLGLSRRRRAGPPLRGVDDPACRARRSSPRGPAP